MKNAGHRSWASVLGLTVAASLLLAAPAGALLEELRDSVQEFELENGLRFLVVERHDAPVFSYATCVDAGGVCEEAGKTGIAHMFEHMAFKGTETIGTTDFEAERQAMAKVDALWDEIRAEQAKGRRADTTRLAELREEFDAALEASHEYVVQNDFWTVIEENGGRMINAFTGVDVTCYFYSLPSNRLELCARMEGDRMAHPVLREFYQERDVVRTERRNSESSPMGRLWLNSVSLGFEAHPYRDGVIGHVSDIEAFHRRDARAFFDTYYVSNNMTVVFVGDVTLDEVKRFARKYFSDVREAPDPPPVVTVEPEHKAERRLIMEEDANPVVMAGYLCPAASDPDYATAELMMEILAGGRSSRLYERLVKQEQIATQAGAGTGNPGEKYPNMAGIFVYLAAGEDPFEAEQIVYEEIDRLIAEGPTPEELEKVKTGYLARQMRQLREPGWFALFLGMAEAVHGHWSELFNHLDRIEAVTPEQVQALAAKMLLKENRSVAIMTKPAPEAEGGEQS